MREFHFTKQKSKEVQANLKQQDIDHRRLFTTDKRTTTKMARFTHCEDEGEAEAVIPWIRSNFLTNHQDSEINSASYSNIQNQAVPGALRGSVNNNTAYHDLYRISRSASLEPPQLSGSTRRNIKRCILQTFLLVLIVNIIWRYMPPPPSPYTSWNDYTNELKASIANTSILISYVTIGLIKNAAQDIGHHGRELSQYIMDRIIVIRIKTSSHIGALVYPRRLSNDTTCTFRLPHNLPHMGTSTRMASSTTEDFLMHEIIGQDKAIKAIARALDAWIQPSLHSDERLSNTRNDNGKPLFLILAGTEGVGKTQTATALASMLLGHCLKNPNTKELGAYPKDRVLILHGYDYSPLIQDDNRTGACTSDNALDITQECSVDTSLVDIIAKHTLDSQELGNIIILDHIENISPFLLRQLGEMIQKSKVFHPKIHSHRRVSLQNTIFIGTTDWGSDWIFTLLRKYSRPIDIPYRELQNAIKEDIRQHIGDNVCFYNGCSWLYFLTVSLVTLEY